MSVMYAVCSYHFSINIIIIFTVIKFWWKYTTCSSFLAYILGVGNVSFKSILTPIAW